MGKHLIVGAGPVGRATAVALLAQGQEVVVVSRSGSGVDDERVRCLALDASDSAVLASQARGAAALYNCANPPYHRWAEEWPPLADSLLAAAEASGAVLVTMSNLYGYGPVDHPMRPADPLAASFKNGRIRAQMWLDAKAAHDAGAVRATEARASDFFGPGTDASSHLGRALPPLLAGRRVRVLGDPDQPHSWSYVPDVGRVLARLGTDERAWGRAWHVPSSPPQSQRQVLEQAASLAGLASPRISQIPRPRGARPRARLTHDQRAANRVLPVRCPLRHRRERDRGRLRPRADTSGRGAGSHRGRGPRASRRLASAGHRAGDASAWVELLSRARAGPLRPRDASPRGSRRRRGAVGWALDHGAWPRRAPGRPAWRAPGAAR